MSITFKAETIMSYVRPTIICFWHRTCAEPLYYITIYTISCFVEYVSDDYLFIPLIFVFITISDGIFQSPYVFITKDGVVSINGRIVVITQFCGDRFVCDKHKFFY